MLLNNDIVILPVDLKYNLFLSSYFSLKDKKSYSCPVCEKSFSEDRLIKSHIKINHPGKKKSGKFSRYITVQLYTLQ